MNVGIRVKENIFAAACVGNKNQFVVYISGGSGTQRKACEKMWHLNLIERWGNRLKIKLWLSGVYEFRRKWRWTIRLANVTTTNKLPKKRSQTRLDMDKVLKWVKISGSWLSLLHITQIKQDDESFSKLFTIKKDNKVLSWLSVAMANFHSSSISYINLCNWIGNNIAIQLMSTSSLYINTR